MKTTIIIPARIQSTRLPRKLLLSETGQPLILHTYHAACDSKLADQVVVATDSEEIAAVVRSVGGIAVLTSVEHQSGTDRVAEAARQIDSDLIINVQGDEPELDGAAIDVLIAVFEKSERVQIATLATPIQSHRDYADPACVKVVTRDDGQALYFSRSPLPALRQPDQFDHWQRELTAPFLQHVGIYGYRSETLQKIAQLTPTPLEKMESLEQLRFLENGYSIHVEKVEHYAHGIDTPQDYQSFVKRHGKG